MNRSSLILVLGACLVPGLGSAQTSPEIWTITSPLNLSQSECIRQANISLRAQRWRTTWSDGNVTNGQANNYGAQILCRSTEQTVTFIVAGPSRNRARSLAESLYKGNNVWARNNNNALQPLPNLSFDEQFYLTNNPDVAAAVQNRTFPSGAAHYQEFGRREGRAPRFDEQYYLSRNPDVARGVRMGEFRNGRDHWDRFGRFEGRPGGVGSLGQPQGQLSN